MIQNRRDLAQIMIFGLGTREGGAHGEDDEHGYYVCAFF